MGVRALSFKPLCPNTQSTSQGWYTEVFVCDITILMMIYFNKYYKNITRTYNTVISYMLVPRIASSKEHSSPLQMVKCVLASPEADQGDVCCLI